jgi:hypothetical protein
LTKAIEWEYEEEWRIIDYDNGPGEKVFPDELLVGVILGVRMPSATREYIVNLLKQRRSPVKIYEGTLSKSSYSLEIKVYKP